MSQQDPYRGFPITDVTKSEDHSNSAWTQIQQVSLEHSAPEDAGIRENQNQEEAFTSS